MLGYQSEIQGVEWPLVEPLEEAVEAVLRNVSPSWNLSIRGAESTLDVSAVCDDRSWTTQIAADIDAPVKVVRWLRGLIAGQSTRPQIASV
jgi:hypothetical protein